MNKSFYKNELERLLKDRYSKILPKFKEQKVQAFTTFVLTIISLSIFGIFAINPTLSTITQLQKELEDKKFIDKMLEEKINNLNTLQQKYSLLQEDFRFVMAAIPDYPATTSLIGQIQNLAAESEIKVISFNTSQIDLSKSSTNSEKNLSFNFNLQIEGNYSNLLNFLSSFTNFDRIIGIDNIIMGRASEKNTNLKINISGKAYYK